MITRYPITGNNLIETLYYTSPEQSGGKGLVWINQTQYFENVPPQVWNFCLKGYQFCQKWLKERQGSSLSGEDIQRYQRIILLVKEIIELMVGIDTAIQNSQFQKRKIFEKVQVIVAKQLGIEQNQISLTSNFADNLGADSLDMLELYIILEKVFGIQINNTFAEDISTVENLVNYINQLAVV
ncbi:acyl carrier protein [Nostocales cyanobacterium HT-58-2]|nr:acyl carrier protein [Nostocales cyanobacterium HT-58-2]